MVTIEEAEAPSDEVMLAHLRAEIEMGDRDIAEGRVSPAEDVFARLRAASPGSTA
jgi:hypothetical protein